MKIDRRQAIAPPLGTIPRLIAALVIASLVACTPVAQPTNGELASVDRTPAGHPKLDGIWQAFVTANWDIRPHIAAAGPISALGAAGAAPPGLGIVEGGEIPYLDGARAQQAENYANRLALDPEVKCFMPGVPRATYMPQPFQILQTDELVMIAYQYANAVRTVHLNDPGPAPTSFWMGWSVGHWEGDTLVVEVTKQKADTWLDRAGNFHSAATGTQTRSSSKRQISMTNGRSADRARTCGSPKNSAESRMTSCSTNSRSTIRRLSYSRGPCRFPRRALMNWCTSTPATRAIAA